jgi:leader peptidase (prepilin peptidase) / N-methyltransferase
MDVLSDVPLLRPLLAFMAFVFGAMIGSFLNVCVYRLPRNVSVAKGRSHCPHCGEGIAWYDNIPILSWLILGARCRNCAQPISWQYPVVEAITGFLFLLVFLKFGLTLATPVYMGLAGALVLVTFVDLTDWTIPNEVTFPGIPLGVVFSVVAMLYPGSNLILNDPVASLIGVAVGGGSLYLLDKLALLLLKKRGMGFGDVKLLAMLGAFFGWQGVLLIIMMASFAGSIIGVAVILAQKRRTVRAVVPEAGDDAGEEDVVVQEGGHYLPFGPYLALAGVLYMFFGPELIAYYVGTLQAPPIMPDMLP